MESFIIFHLAEKLDLTLNYLAPVWIIYWYQQITNIT